MLYPPPPSSLYPGQHHAYCKTLVALEDGQVVIKCHQHHQLLFKICYLYVTNVYSYVLMMQIKFVFVLYLYAKYNVLRLFKGSTCLTCLIENNALDTFLVTSEMCFFQVNLSSICREIWLTVHYSHCQFSQVQYCQYESND